MVKPYPPGVFVKAGRYYRVRCEGKRRIWIGLSRTSEGLPALYRALADLEQQALPQDRMPALIAAWQRDVMERHAAKTQVDEKRRCAQMQLGPLGFPS